MALSLLFKTFGFCKVSMDIWLGNWTPADVLIVRP